MEEEENRLQGCLKWDENGEDNFQNILLESSLSDNIIFSNNLLDDPSAMVINYLAKVIKIQLLITYKRFPLIVRKPINCLIISVKT